MQKAKKRLLRNESGDVVIEASLVVTFSGICVLAILLMGYVIYQQALMQASANKTAADVAAIYAIQSKDPIYGYTSRDTLANAELYRVFTSKLDNQNARKAQWFMLYNVKRQTLMPNFKLTVAAVVERKPDTLALRKQVKVTATANYSIPLLKLLSVNGDGAFTVTAYAECHDEIDYINTVDMAFEAANGILEAKTLKTINGLADIIKNFIQKNGDQ
jgi:hypothetical protein